ncbi:M28 family peptidase [Flagellimonas okinawensis]|uniref:Vacuolar membrane protease n=1 Tax=Flagellimonas okinawensis TaxID=3031324 RepID=A0ABT5XQF9_9FLAO|nr:M28 family peptidase [[Muricauda] okinawensis]MDF0707831.1 M28 family peptidase [[Muricauda] okinawensis]
MKFSRTLALILLVIATYWSFKSAMPNYSPNEEVAMESFSTDRALAHVKQLSKEPHAVGFSGHERAKDYIIAELNKLGLETIIQEGYTAGDWGNLSKATNILARIKGSGNGKALLLLSHYDSGPHSSYGASDAGSGVATILEGARAYLSTNTTPKNDIIILITDAEELGLNGADLFVNNHPWAKDVGLALNFEARGSGGPSYMLIETNRGNGTLIKEFTEAHPKYPVANSLVYSIYKMLPNDTDLTVFREDGDIEGFNFAFIDDHFDYHTALDTYERLDRNTLAHQGSYLMPLLNHFSNADLGNLKSLNDYVYFNMPIFKLISYPFEWIWPMFGLAILAFISLLVFGFQKSKLNIKDILKGFIPVLITLIINGLAGYFCWSIITWWYPGFKDILHGFTYNGYTYIAVYVLFSLFVCFYSYNKFRKISTSNLLVAPIIIWLIICGLGAQHLKGASFFTVPLFGLLAGLLVTINQEKPNPFLMVFLALPAVLIYSPFIKMFPVGLGLKMMIAATLLTTLLFYLVLPFFGQLKNKGRLAYLFLLLFFAFGISSHIQSDFSESKPKPSSLLYIYDTDKDSTFWATYDHELISWNNQFLGEAKRKPSSETISSKYRTNLNYISDAPKKDIPTPYIDTVMDTIIGENRIVELCITPNRNVNRLEVFTNPIKLKKASVNRIELSPYFLENRSSRLVTHYITNNNFTELQLEFPKDSVLELTLYEASNDLLTHPDFSIPERPKTSIPMPFVLNDAILMIKTLRFE